MSTNTYEHLNDLHMDALREIGNIGSGNAASALSALLSCPFTISVPTVRILDYSEVAGDMGGPEQMIVGALLFLEGDVQGMILFLLQEGFASATLEALLGEPVNSLDGLDEMAQSALQEVANIMAASYLNAIASLTGMTITISTPSLCTDMLGAILSVPAIYYANISDKIIYIEDELRGENLCAPNHILLIPDTGSLEKIITRLGLEL